MVKVKINWNDAVSYWEDLSNICPRDLYQHVQHPQQQNSIINKWIDDSLGVKFTTNAWASRCSVEFTNLNQLIYFCLRYSTDLKSMELYGNNVLQQQHEAPQYLDKLQ